MILNALNVTGLPSAPGSVEERVTNLVWEHRRD
jgi:hypothetical protein